MQNLKQKSKLREKISQDGIFYNLTRSICPTCKSVIDAQIIVRGKEVYMRKRCKEHGWFESLISSDFTFYRYAELFNKPGTIPFEFQTKVQDGCPLDCGLCSEHKQHTCLGILEITSKCNMNCPICFAETGSRSEGHHLSLRTIRSMIDTLLQSEGPAEIIQLSGGEPTLHPDLLTILHRLKKFGIKKILINTNGRNLRKIQIFA
ncbi:MAG: radical SAM protein [Candidatus Hodarchaeota archaeon]